jgi:hypothetical protein
VPQFDASVLVFTHAPPHAVIPVGQPHAPLEHVCPAGHACPQAPQFALSVIVSTQLPAQSVCPAPQPHIPLMHGCPDAHAWPHVPQLAPLIRTSTHALAQHSSGDAHGESTSHPTTHAPCRQIVRVGHCDVMVHCTHVCVVVSQCTLAPASAAVAHPSWRWHPATHA